jgi:hypothetical protein
MYKSERLSKEAKLVIKNDSIKAFEFLSHDGYDGDGPVSDIWDLFVFEEKIFHYHRENWFNGHCETYRLYEEWNLSEFKSTGYYKLIKDQI